MDQSAEISVTSYKKHESLLQLQVNFVIFRKCLEVIGNFLYNRGVG